MGWLFMSSLGGHAGPKAYLDAQFTFQNEEGTSEVLASALVGMRTWYAACRQFNKKTGKREVFALVCLLRYNKRARDGMIFGYKDISECMGPCEAECPAHILNLLDPTGHPHALDWRARCRAAVAKRHRPQPKDGDTIIFAESLHFVDGSEARRFRVQIGKRRVRFINPETGGRCRIPRWQDRAYSIVPKIDCAAAPT